jgi:hypothetical protein
MALSATLLALAAHAACNSGPDFCQDDPRIAAKLLAKKQTLAREYPARLVALLDRGQQCVARIDRSPDIFTLWIVRSDNAKHGSLVLGESDERHARGEVRRAEALLDRSSLGWRRIEAERQENSMNLETRSYFTQLSFAAVVCVWGGSAGAEIVAVQAKSYIALVNLLDPMQFDADAKSCQQAMAALVDCGTLNENPTDGAKESKNFRLRSELPIDVTCANNKVANWEFKPIQQDFGSEFVIFATTGKHRLVRGDLVQLTKSPLAIACVAAPMRPEST